jgi:hypothetical protein
MKTKLCEIMTKHGSDKGIGVHNYTLMYYEMFKDLQNKKLNIFELGLGTNNTDVPSNMGKFGKPGASLRGWREFFTNSNVFGADVDKRILFNEERIKTFYCNQKDVLEIERMWNNPTLKDILFDIIIEDGLHEFDANLIFLENSLHKINEGGIYICEDLKIETVELFKKEILSLKKKYPNFDFEVVILENINNKYNDNNLLLVKKLN